MGETTQYGRNCRIRASRFWAERMPTPAGDLVRARPQRPAAEEPMSRIHAEA